MDDKYEMIRKDVLWVLQYFGSDAEEKTNPGSKIRNQAKRIAEMVRQLDEAEILINNANLDLVKVVPR